MPLASNADPNAMKRAEAIAGDHAEGLHEDWYDATVGCRYPGCEDAFWLIAADQEDRPL